MTGFLIGIAHPNSNWNDKTLCKSKSETLPRRQEGLIPGTNLAFLLLQLEFIGNGLIIFRVLEGGGCRVGRLRNFRRTDHCERVSFNGFSKGCHDVIKHHLWLIAFVCFFISIYIIYIYI